MTQPQPFKESLRETRPGTGPDFPGSSGDRERGKFRPSATPRLVTMAVVGDDGRPLALTTEQLLDQVIWTNLAILWALSALADGASFTVDEALAEAR